MAVDMTQVRKNSVVRPEGGAFLARPHYRQCLLVARKSEMGDGFYIALCSEARPRADKGVCDSNGEQAHLAGTSRKRDSLDAAGLLAGKSFTASVSKPSSVRHSPLATRHSPLLLFLPIST